MYRIHYTNRPPPPTPPPTPPTPPPNRVIKVGFKYHSHPEIFKGVMYFTVHLLISIGVVLVVVNKSGCV